MVFCLFPSRETEHQVGSRARPYWTSHDPQALWHGVPTQPWALGENVSVSCIQQFFHRTLIFGRHWPGTWDEAENKTDPVSSLKGLESRQRLLTTCHRADGKDRVLLKQDCQESCPDEKTTELYLRSERGPVNGRLRERYPMWKAYHTGGSGAGTAFKEGREAAAVI